MHYYQIGWLKWRISKDQDTQSQGSIQGQNGRKKLTSLSLQHTAQFSRLGQIGETPERCSKDPNLILWGSSGQVFILIVFSQGDYFPKENASLDLLLSPQEARSQNLAFNQIVVYFQLQVWNKIVFLKMTDLYAIKTEQIFINIFPFGL